MLAPLTYSRETFILFYNKKHELNFITASNDLSVSPVNGVQFITLSEKYTNPAF